MAEPQSEGILPFYLDLLGQSIENAPQRLWDATRFLQGTPEAATTMASGLLSMPRAGYEGLLVGSTNPEQRPMGVWVDGQWIPSLLGTDPMPAAAAVERRLESGTMLPGSDAGMETLQGIGGAMETLIDPVRSAGDTAITKGMEWGLPPEVLAGLTAGGMALLDTIPGPPATAVAKGVSRAVRPTRMLDSIDMPDSGFGGIGEPYVPLTGQVTPLRPGQPSIDQMGSTLQYLDKYDETMAAHFARAQDKANPDRTPALRSGQEPGAGTSSPVPITKELKNADLVEMVPIEQIERLKVENRLTTPKSLLSVDEPTENVLRGLRNDLVSGKPIHTALDVEVNPENGLAFLGDGNTRLAVIKEAGYTHVPVRVTRTNTQIGQKLDITGDAFADKVRPSDFGLGDEVQLGQTGFGSGQRGGPTAAPVADNALAVPVVEGGQYFRGSKQTGGANFNGSPDGPTDTGAQFVGSRETAELYAKNGGQVFSADVPPGRYIDASTKHGSDLIQQFQKETGINPYLKSTDRGSQPNWTVQTDLEDWLNKKGIEYDGVFYGENNNTASLALKGRPKLDVPANDGKGVGLLGDTQAGRFMRGSIDDTGGGKKVLGTQAGRAGLLDISKQKRDVLTAKERTRVKGLVDRYPGLRPLLPYMTVNERRHLNKYRAEGILEVWDELDPSEMASVALAGQAKRGWYERSGQAIKSLFGEQDAPRFAGLLAALSPQTSVESNLRNALNVWIEWDRAGRPNNPDQILEIMGRSVEGDKGLGSVLEAWQNNSVRALTADDATLIRLSGPKVDSFMRNIWGEFGEVTNDAWIAKYTGVDPQKLGGSINVAGTDPGKSGLYTGVSMAQRKAADLLTRRTGEKWTPAEVQETVWSWAMAIYEKADSDVTPIQNLINKLTHGDVYQTPDFAKLLSEPGDYRSIIETGNFNGGIQRLDELAGRSVGPTVDPTGTTAQAPGIQSRHLDAAAARLEKNRRQSRKPKVIADLRGSVDRSVASGQSSPYRSTVAPNSSRNLAQTIELGDPKRTQLMNSLGMSTPPVQELKPTSQAATKFHNAINRAKQSNEWGAQVTAKSVEEYQGLRMFLTEDGKAGFAINPEDGDIVSLFNAGNSKHEGVSAHLVMMAIAQGGRKLDNYDTFLSSIYKRLGFEEKGRFKWDESQKPTDWDYNQYKDFNDGRPDYVFMEYKPTEAEPPPGLLSPVTD